MGRLSGTFIAISALALVVALGPSATNTGLAQDASNSSGGDPIEAGRARFNVRCAGCHGQDGLGGERAPAIGKGSQTGLDDDKTLRKLIRQGLADKGMPAFDLPAGEFDSVVAFARSRILP